MAFGLSIVNSNGTAIISEEYSNYHVVASGTIANSTNYADADVADPLASIPGVQGGDIIWVRPHIATGGYYLKFKWTTMSSSNSTPVDKPKFYSSSGSFEYVVARKSPSPSANSFGLRVLRSDGTVAFDYALRPVAPVLTFRDSQNETWSSTHGIYSTTISAPAAPPTNRGRFVSLAGIAPVNAAFNSTGGGTTIHYGSNIVTFTNTNSFTVSGDAYPTGSGTYSFGNRMGTIYYTFADIVV